MAGARAVPGLRDADHHRRPRRDHALMATTEVKPEDRLCKACGRAYATYELRPCEVKAGTRGGSCLECALFGEATEHWEMVRDVDEVASNPCPHGTDYTELCKGCGAKVGAWGVGAAGFGEDCPHCIEEH